MLVTDTRGRRRIDNTARGIPNDFALNLVEARLSLSSTDATPTSSITAATTVYLHPYRGNRLALYETGNRQWVPRSLSSAVSVAVPSTLFRLFDLYAYWAGTTIALETVNWNQSTYTITGVSIAATPTVTTSAAHGRSVGDLVGLAGITGTAGTDTNNGLNGRVVTVAATPTATTFTVEGADTSGLAYSSGGTVYTVPNTRATALATQDGVKVKSGNAARRYLGVGMTTGTSGQCETNFGGASAPAKWVLENYYNQLPVALYRQESENSWVYTTAAFRPANNRLGNRLEALCGVRERPVRVTTKHVVQTDSTQTVSVGVGVNRATTNAAQVQMPVYGPGTTVPVVADYEAIPAEGFTYYQWLEFSEATGTTYWFGDSGSTFIQAALTATLWA